MEEGKCECRTFLSVKYTCKSKYSIAKAPEDATIGENFGESGAGGPTLP